MKKRKKNLKGAQRPMNKSFVGNEQVNATVKSKKDFDKMNLFERMAYLEEIRNNSKIIESRIIKSKNQKNDDEEEKNWSIDDKNWDKLFEACKQCVRYCRQKAEDDPNENNTHKDSKANAQSKSKGRKSKVDLEKLKVFLKANAERKVTKTEVRDFCGVSSFSIVRVELKKLADAEEYFSYIIDLRKDNTPKDELIIPGEDSENKLVNENSEGKENSEDAGIINDSENLITENINSDVEAENDDNPEKTVIGTFSKLIPEQIEAVDKNDVVVEKITNKESGTSKIEVMSAIESDVDPAVELESEKTRIIGTQQNVVSIKHSKYPKPVAKVRQLFNLRKPPTRNFVFDESIFELNDIMAYDAIVNECFLNYNVILWISLNQFYTLDSIKKDCCVAQELLRTIALDDGSHIKLIKEEIPEGEKLASFCKTNNLTLVSGLPINVIWCKANGVDVMVPNYFKKLCPSPFKGDEIIGVDSNLLIHGKTQSIFEKAKKVWVSDIQLRELTVTNTGFWAEIAYYADFDKAETVVNNHSDTNLLTFFKSKNVDKVYSADYGFLVLAKFMGISGDVVYISSVMKESSRSIVLELSKKQKCTVPEIMKKVKPGEVVSLNAIREKNENKLRVFTKIKDVDIFVYDSHRRPKKSILRFIDVEKGDELLVQEGNVILIVKIINTSEALGEVIYYGEEQKLPNNLIFIK